MTLFSSGTKLTVKNLAKNLDEGRKGSILAVEEKKIFSFFKTSDMGLFSDEEKKYIEKFEECKKREAIMHKNVFFIEPDSFKERQTFFEMIKFLISKEENLVNLQNDKGLVLIGSAMFGNASQAVLIAVHGVYIGTNIFKSKFIAKSDLQSITADGKAFVFRRNDGKEDRIEMLGRKKEEMNYLVDFINKIYF